MRTERNATVVYDDNLSFRHFTKWMKHERFLKVSFVSCTFLYEIEYTREERDQVSSERRGRKKEKKNRNGD